MNTLKENLLFDHLKQDEGEIHSAKSFCRFVFVFKTTFFSSLFLKEKNRLFQIWK